MTETVELVEELPVIAPTRRSMGPQPFRAIKYLASSLWNVRDTISQARLGESTLQARFFRNAAAFADSPSGRRLYSQEGDLSDWIDDQSLWDDCGPETVAAHYQKFMERQNTNAKELKQLSRQWRMEDGWHDDRVGWYIVRAYSTHDICHVLFGYDFDVLGELCLMACISPHYPSIGIAVQLQFGARRLSGIEPYPGYAKAAVDEAYAIGRNVPAVWEQDIRELMRMDLTAARKKLGIRLPELYKRLQ